MNHEWDGINVPLSETINITSQRCLKCGQLAIDAGAECDGYRLALLRYHHNPSNETLSACESIERTRRGEQP